MNNVQDWAKALTASVVQVAETFFAFLPSVLGSLTMRRLRRSRRQIEGEIYVLDRKHALLGVTTMHALVKAPPDQLISESTSTECARMLAATPQRDLVFHPLWVEHNSVAVVDEDNVLLGVVDHRAVEKAGERLRAARKNESGLEAALALGELYWLALREIRSSDFMPVLIKEAVAGSVNGIAIAVCFWSGSLGLCLVIFLAMIISMAIAGVAGAAIPLILASIKQDPAQSGSIILTTVTDVFGFFSFLGLATLFSTML